MSLIIHFLSQVWPLKGAEDRTSVQKVLYLKRPFLREVHTCLAASGVFLVMYIVPALNAPSLWAAQKMHCQNDLR